MDSGLGGSSEVNRLSTSIVVNGLSGSNGGEWTCDFNAINVRGGTNIANIQGGYGMVVLSGLVM